VDQEEIDVVDAEALRAAGPRLLDPLDAVPRAVQLGRHEKLLARHAAGRKSAADTLLVAVAVCGIEQPVARLGVDYIDLFLIHWPLPRQDRYVDAVRGLAKLLDDGRVRAFGGSNFKPAHLDRVLAESGIVPDVNQIQLSPYTTRDEARAYHAAHGIVTQSWSPLGLGGELLRDPVIVEVAGRHDKSAAQIVLRWHIQLGLSVVPKSANPQRIVENIEVYDFELSDEEVAALSALDRGEAFADDSDVMGH
jgi:2,5-diketo-D-gluconate reductase A